MNMKRILFFIALSFSTPGCVSFEYNLATGREEMSFYSTEKEVKLGRNLSRSVEASEKLLPDVPLQEHIDDIGRKIADSCDRKDITYHFAVLEREGLNAFALPGGYVYINSGLINSAESDDEIACVIGHEIGHIAARHSIKRLQAHWGATILLLLSRTEGRLEEWQIKEALNELMLSYSREDEILADRLGVKYARSAGYDPAAMLTFLRRLREKQREEPLKPKIKYQTHPYLGDRIRAVKLEIGEPVDFLDYVNAATDLQ